jgi:hypothetical protein
MALEGNGRVRTVTPATGKKAKAYTRAMLVRQESILPKLQEQEPVMIVNMESDQVLAGRHARDAKQENSQIRKELGATNVKPEHSRPVMLGALPVKQDNR